MLTQATSAAWHQGKRLLERASAERLHFAFETTLAENTIPGLHEAAAAAGIDLRIWYVGLATPELHIARVRSRVAAGGHDIPEDKIRARFRSSRMHLIRLLPHLAELRLYDNSAEADPKAGATPKPILILHIDRGKIVNSCRLTDIPNWAKPIMAAAIKGK